MGVGYWSALGGLAAAILFPATAKAACSDLAAAHFEQAVTLAAIEDTGDGCRVRGTIAPAAGSHIGFEAWLPARWNGKFEMIGNGGYSSAIDTRAAARLVALGYAVAATDTGHAGDDPAFAKDHPQAIIDWGYRAVHLTAVTAKGLVAAHYGRPPSHAYFSGCSTGGQQALMEAQRFPGDFDGIIAGDPGNNRTRLNLGFLWLFEKTHRPDGSAILTADDLRLVNSAVLAACAGKDGGAPGDRFLTDPFACAFDPEHLVCRDTTGGDCLTGEQADAVKAVYDGARNPRTGQSLYYGWVRGSEAGEGFVKALPGWSLYWADPLHPNQPARLNFWRDWLYFDDNWDPWRFDFDEDADRLSRDLGPVIDAVDPNISAFIARGGKLIQYHGLADPVVPPMDSAAYARAVLAYAAVHDVDAARAYRLFLIPGMAHCGGGEGPVRFDMQAALEDWVEKDRAPSSLIGKSIDGRSARPLCAYPEKAVYRGGDPAAPASFACRASAKD